MKGLDAIATEIARREGGDKKLYKRLMRAGYKFRKEQQRRKWQKRWNSIKVR